MQRHDLSLTSLIAGLLFLALSVAYVVGAYTDVRLDPRLWFPLTLVGLGLAGLAGSIAASSRAQRRAALAESASTDDAATTATSGASAED